MRCFQRLITLCCLLFISDLSSAADRCETSLDLHSPISFTDSFKDHDRKTYSILLSKDLDALRSFRFTGPGPQGNMSRDTTQEQFYINSESSIMFRQKEKLLSLPSRRAKMIQVLPEFKDQVLQAAKEQFAAMCIDLPKRYPQSFEFKNGRLLNRLNNQSFTLSNFSRIKKPEAAIEVLSFFVNEDLVFLQRVDGGDDFVVIGGLIAVPTHISIEAILGKGIIAIHGQVSSDPEKVKSFSSPINNSLARLFLSTDTIVRRNNFSFEFDPTLSMPFFRTSTYRSPTNIDSNNYQENIFIRCERQTLRGLTDSQVVVFSILPMVFAMREILSDPELGKTVVNGIALKYNGDSDLDQWARKIVQYTSK